MLLRLCLSSLTLALAVALALVARVEAQEKPEGYQQILPRGRIAAIEEPRFVPASEARISPSSWVLGVVIEGEARAYSLNLLNSHEVVNDEIGETRYAAVW